MIETFLGNAYVSWQTVGYFLKYFVVAIITMGIFLTAYTSITPCKEWVWSKEGNIAAALSLSGAMLGFALPLTYAIFQSASIADLLVWSSIAAGVQLLMYGINSLVIRNFTEALHQGNIAVGIISFSFAVSSGLLNAVCMTYTPLHP
jgi:putative membrane protein